MLLCRPSYTDQWSLPGGGVDPGETPVQAVLREVPEETGLEVQVRRLASIAMSGEDRLVFCLERSVVGGELTTSGETVDFRYFAVDALPANFSTLQRRMVASVLDSPPEPAFGE